MRNLIRVRGWVNSSWIIHPNQSWCEDKPKYGLQLHPEYPIYDEIENKIEVLQDEHRRERELLGPMNPDEIQRQPSYQSRVIDNCLICTESLHPPKTFELDWIKDDLQLIGEFINTVGHLTIHELSGDVYLTSHIVEKAHNPCEGFDPIASGFN